MFLGLVIKPVNTIDTNMATKLVLRKHGFDMGLTRLALLIDLGRISLRSASEEALNLEIYSLLQTPRLSRLRYCRPQTNPNRPD